jgi:hypothetical protein
MGLKANDDKKRKEKKAIFLYCLQLGPFVDLMISLGYRLVLGP